MSQAIKGQFSINNTRVDGTLTGANTLLVNGIGTYAPTRRTVYWENILDKPSVFPPAITVDEEDEAVVVEVS